MKHAHTPPRQKKPGEKNKIAEDTRGKHPGEENDTSSGPEGESASDAASPSPEELITRSQKPVTNQDEQEKITNAGDDDIPVADK